MLVNGGFTVFDVNVLVAHGTVNLFKTSCIDSILTFSKTIKQVINLLLDQAVCGGRNLFDPFLLVQIGSFNEHAEFIN